MECSTYDGGDNILTKNTYACTTEEDPGTAQSTIDYGCGNSNWKDQLTSYNGTTITYDASGNPLNWRNASAMNWTGRQLDSMTLTNGTALSFLYNSDGLRVSKTVGSNTVKYRWDGAPIAQTPAVLFLPYHQTVFATAFQIGEPVRISTK